MRGWMQGEGHGPIPDHAYSLSGSGDLCRSSAQTSAGYVTPSDSPAHAKLEQFQDWKFGLMLHWGTYSQWGIVESWSLCPEDEPWCERKGPHANDYSAYVKAFESLQTTFNPVRFDPDRWATAAQEAGMRYVVFTTKHHDGFSMFDTRETTYKDGQVAYTRGNDGIVNAIYLAREEEIAPPASIVIPAFTPASGSEVQMLGVQEPLRWERRGKGCVVHIPASVRNTHPAQWAWTVVLSHAEED